MSSNPRIFVFKTREIIYTFLLIFLAVLLVLCLVLMFTKKKSEPQSLTSNTGSSQSITSDSEQNQATGAQNASGSAIYTPGVYTTSVSLGDSTADVEVTVDSGHINSIRLVNLSEAAAASFPLVTPSLDHIASQILETQSLENITCPQENRYTSQMLLTAIADTLNRAASVQQ